MGIIWYQENDTEEPKDKELVPVQALKILEDLMMH
jgi:hypothetical protein